MTSTFNPDRSLAAGMYLALGALALTLAGCQTTQASYAQQTAQYEQKVTQAWAGDSPYELTGVWGKAHGVKVESGAPALIYQMSRIYGAGDYIVPNSFSREVPVANGTALVINDVPSVFPSRARPLKRTCQTEFLLGSDGLIESVEARGACLPGDVDRRGAPYRMVLASEEDIYRTP